MSDVPRQWFSNGRGLPLDKNGRVDFSLETTAVAEPEVCRYDPVHGERFMGRLFDQLPMPDGGRIIQLIRWDTTDPDLPLQVANHNVFRLDREGKVIWQVRREERGFVNWEACHQQAKEADPNCEGHQDPFTNMSEYFFVRRPLPYKGPFHPKLEQINFTEYAPGRLVRLNTHWWGYDLNPETGVATCTGEQVR